MEDQKWKDIKEFYSDKKENWAKTDCYYSKIDKWGDLHGYELKPPYTEEEVEDIDLPDDLKTYLTTVSREIFVSYYPCQFSLYNEETSCWFGDVDWVDSSDIKDCCVKDCDKDHVDCCDESCTYNHDKYIDDGMVRVGEGGCSFSDQIVVKGNHLGTVWRCDGDVVNKDADTFMEYLLRDIPKYKKPVEPINIGQAATIFNFMRILNGQPGWKY